MSASACSASRALPTTWRSLLSASPLRAAAQSGSLTEITAVRLFPITLPQNRHRIEYLRTRTILCRFRTLSMGFPRNPPLRTVNVGRSAREQDVALLQLGAVGDRLRRG